MLSQIHGLQYVTVVPHNVIGTGQRFYDPFRNVVGIMINRCLHHKPIIVYGDGEQKRSFSNVYDCIRAVHRIMESTRTDLCGQVYNIGPDENEITIKELAYKVGHFCQVYLTYNTFLTDLQKSKMLFAQAKK